MGQTAVKPDEQYNPPLLQAPPAPANEYTREQKTRLFEAALARAYKDGWTLDTKSDDTPMLMPPPDEQSVLGVYTCRLDYIAHKHTLVPDEFFLKYLPERRLRECTLADCVPITRKRPTAAAQVLTDMLSV